MKNTIKRIAKILEVILFYLITAPVTVITATVLCLVFAIAAVPYMVCSRIAESDDALYDNLLNSLYSAVGKEKEKEKEDIFDEDNDFDELEIII